MASSGERVICTVCSEKIILKNLKTHYFRNHPSLPVKYKSATNENIGKFFSNVEPPVKKLKTTDNETSTTKSSTTDLPSTYFEEKRTDAMPGIMPATTTSSSSTVFDYEQIQTLLEKVKGKKINQLYNFFMTSHL